MHDSTQCNLIKESPNAKTFPIHTSPLDLIFNSKHPFKIRITYQYIFSAHFKMNLPGLQSSKLSSYTRLSTESLSLPSA